MRYRWLAIVGLLLVQSMHEQTLARSQASDVRVTDQREIELPEATPFGLSPDGRWLGVRMVADGSICLSEVVSLAPVSCVGLGADSVNGSIDFETIAWSPDGSRIAFTENSARNFQESDVWVLEVASGTLTNLTDDRVEGDLTRGLDGSPAFFDQAPAWSPDGQRLAFTRTLVDDDVRGPTLLYWVDLVGGVPIEVAKVSTEPFTVRFGLAWSPDGTHLVYSANTRKDTQSFGLWVVNLADGSRRQLVGRDSQAASGMHLLEVSAGGLALIAYDEPTPLPGGWASPFALVDIELGTVAALDQDGLALQTATFSPDGSKVLYTAIANDRQTDVLVVQDIGWSGRELMSEIGPTSYSEYRNGLTWASNNTVFVPVDLLLRLDIE